MPYVALLIFPLVSILFPNPVEVWWLIKVKEPRPMPPEVMDVHMGIGVRLQMVGSFVTITALLVLLMERYSISAGAVGLTLDGWRANFLIGCAGGAIWVGYKVWLARMSKSAKRARSKLDLGRPSEPLLFWVPGLVVFACVEEFWRAFCLNAFRSRGDPMAIAILLTALAFGIAHLSLRPGGIAAMVCVGVGLGLLFAWRWSLLPTCLVHVITNLDSLQAGRRGQESTEADLPLS